MRVGGGGVLNNENCVNVLASVDISLKLVFYKRGGRGSASVLIPSPL